MEVKFDELNVNLPLRIERLDVIRQELEQKLKQANDKIAALEEQMKKHEESHVQLEAKINSHTNKVTALRSMLSTLHSFMSCRSCFFVLHGSLL